MRVRWSKITGDVWSDKTTSKAMMKQGDIFVFFNTSSGGGGISVGGIAKEYIDLKTFTIGSIDISTSVCKVHGAFKYGKSANVTRVGMLKAGDVFRIRLEKALEHGVVCAPNYIYWIETKQFVTISNPNVVVEALPDAELVLSIRSTLVRGAVINTVEFLAGNKPALQMYRVLICPGDEFYSGYTNVKSPREAAIYVLGHYAKDRHFKKDRKYIDKLLKECEAHHQDACIYVNECDQRDLEYIKKVGKDWNPYDETHWYWLEEEEYDAWKYNFIFPFEDIERGWV